MKTLNICLLVMSHVIFTKFNSTDTSCRCFIDIPQLHSLRFWYPRSFWKQLSENRHYRVGILNSSVITRKQRGEKKTWAPLKRTQVFVSGAIRTTDTQIRVIPSASQEEMWLRSLHWDVLNNSWSRFLVCRCSKANVQHTKKKNRSEHRAHTHKACLLNRNTQTTRWTGPNA